MSKYSDFMSHVRAAVNKDIYLWGGGQPLKTLDELTEAYIRQKETSERNAERVIKLWKKRKPKYPKAHAADCSGGIVYCLQLAGLVSKSFDSNANGLINRCKKLSNKKDLQEGDWVGQKSKSNVFHIGVVDRVDKNGQIWIDEWRGRDYGCVCTKFEKGANPWNVFGRPDWVYKADKVDEKDPIKPEIKPFTVKRTLKLTHPYMKGEDVHNVQNALSSNGYSCGSTGADGIFGTGTKSAVQKFQKANNITSDGIVGKETVTKLGGKWESYSFLLNRILKYKIVGKMRGTDVMNVQNALISKGFTCGKSGADGIFGTGTKDAVIRFQKKNNLKSDGIVGKETCNKLGGKWNA